jgi:hypothetical protein
MLAVLAAVVVQTTPHDLADAHQEAMLEGCSSGFPDGECVLADTEPRSESPRAIAVVVSDARDEVISVSVEVRAGKRVTRQQASLSFVSADDVVERWRAAGLTIASLVGELRTQASAEQAAASVDLEDVSNESGESVSVARPVVGGWLGAAGGLGPGLTSGASRLGANLELAVRVFDPLYGYLSLGHAVDLARPGDALLEWTQIRAGGLARVRLEDAGFALGASLALMAQRFAVTAEGETGARWDPGASLGVRANWPSRSPWSIQTGLEFWGLWRGTVVEVRDEGVGRSPAWGASAWVGVRWGWLAREHGE